MKICFFYSQFSVVQEPLACGHVQTVCLAVEMPGCAPHELLCIHPTVLIEKHATSVPWEGVDGVLRGFLLQMHSLQYAMPEALEGMPCLDVYQDILPVSTCTIGCFFTVLDVVLKNSVPAHCCALEPCLSPRWSRDTVPELRTSYSSTLLSQSVALMVQSGSVAGHGILR